MPDNNYFAERPPVTPTIYAYELIGVESHKGYLKIGYTDRDAETRIAEQMHTSAVPYRIVLKASAMRPDGSCFMDHDIHAVFKKKGIPQLNAGDDKNEWYKCDVNMVKAAIIAVQNGTANIENRSNTFKMRPEQARAVNMTIDYFNRAKKMGSKRVLVLTFKPAVESAWAEDLATHVDFEGWQFISNKDALGNGINIDQAYKNADKDRPIVVFGSFQDLLGTNTNGGIKVKNQFIHEINWDLVTFDEYHFGAWRENAKNCLMIPMKRLTPTLIRKSTIALRPITHLTKHLFLLQQTIIFFSQVHLSVQSIQASLLKTKFSTGLIPMNSVQKRTGLVQTILIFPFREWSCLHIKFPKAFARLQCKVSLMNSI